MVFLKDLKIVFCKQENKKVYRELIFCIYRSNPQAEIFIIPELLQNSKCSFCYKLLQHLITQIYVQQ
jgi:thermostable 8-oxoguanine DNA glycosylase